ncbi:MAG: dTDP-4-dehydrorhamnose reductase [Thermoleophilia bacterium]
MKILIIGAAGQLGHDLLDCLGGDHEVTGVDIGEIDITDAASVATVVGDIRPELVINSAAFTNVDGCETDHEAAWAVNAEGPGHVARASAAIDAPLIHISTDYVFDGSKGEPYREDDPVAPLGEYGRSKLAGEQAVAAALERHLIVRTAWLFGTAGNNFVKTMLRLGRERDQLKVVNDQHGSPTYAGHLARAVKSLAENRLDQPGVYHMTNSGQCTWFEFAAEIFRLAGVEVDLQPTTTAEFGSPAPRPAYSVLANTRAPEIALPDWHDGLVECLLGLNEIKTDKKELS